MRTLEMPELRFSHWYRWEDRSGYGLAKYPGVYLISISAKDDLAGQAPIYDDVVYIGMSAAKKGLASRWKQFDKAIHGIPKKHSGGTTIYKDKGSYDTWPEFLYVAAMGIECNTVRPSCEDYIKMGWAAFFEYEAFSEHCQSQPNKSHPPYNKK